MVEIKPLVIGDLIAKAPFDPIGANLRAIKTEIQKARQLAKEGILGVNIMVATRRYEDYVKAAVGAGIDLIISGAGLPMDLPKLVGDAKTKLAPIVSSVKSAQVIMRYWWKKYNRLPDAVVIEGPLAGGHLGFRKDQLDDIDSLHYDDEVEAIIGQIPHGKCHLCISTCNPAETPYCITDALVNAVEGNTEDALLFCGANAYRATELEHVKDIMNEFRP